jgi:hypothetical protein
MAVGGGWVGEHAKNQEGSLLLENRTALDRRCLGQQALSTKREAFCRVRSTGLSECKARGCVPAAQREKSEQSLLLCLTS